MGISGTSQENELEHSTDDKATTEEESNTKGPDSISPTVKTTSITNYPEYLNPFNSDGDESTKRKSNTIKVTVTELCDSPKYEIDSMHSSMTTLTDDSGSTKSRRRRRRRKLKVQIGSLENVNSTTVQNVNNNLNIISPKSTNYKHMVVKDEQTNVSMDTFNSEVTSDKSQDGATQKSFSNLLCPSFLTSKADDKKEDSVFDQSVEVRAEQVDSTGNGGKNVPPVDKTLQSKKKKKKNKNKKIAQSVNNCESQKQIGKEEVNEDKDNRDEKEATCGTLKNIFSKIKSKEEPHDNKLDELVILPKKLNEERLTQEKLLNQDKKNNETEKIIKELIQFADIVKDKENILENDGITIQSLPKSVDMANEIIHLDDAHLHHAVKTDFTIMRDQTPKKGEKRWNYEDNTEPNEIKMNYEFENPVDEKFFKDTVEQQSQTEEDCKQIDELFNQIIMENEIPNAENNEDIIVSNNCSNLSLEEEFRTSDDLNIEKSVYYEKEPKRENEEMADCKQTVIMSNNHGIKNITVTQSNNGGKDIMEIVPSNLLGVKHSTYDNNLITTTCYQKNPVNYVVQNVENETFETEQVLKSQEPENKELLTVEVAESVTDHESVFKAKEKFVYFDESEDENRIVKTEPECLEKSNIVNSNSQIYNKLSPKRDKESIINEATSFEEDEILQNLLDKLMLSETTEQSTSDSYQETTDNCSKMKDKSNVYVEEYIDDLEDRLDGKQYEEVIIKKEYNVRSMPETCYISVPGCRYLDVITEEASDISDCERNRVISAIEVSDVEDENNPFASINEADSESSDGNGIDISWQGKPLEEIEDIEIVYEEDSSNESTIIENDQRNNNSGASEEGEVDITINNKESKIQEKTPNEIYVMRQNVRVFSPNEKEMKTVQIKTLEQPQRALFFETNSPKSERKAALKKKREAFFSESLDILNTNFSSYCGEVNLFSTAADVDLSNRYPDLINIGSKIDKTNVPSYEHAIDVQPTKDQHMIDNFTEKLEMPTSEISSSYYDNVEIDSDVITMIGTGIVYSVDEEMKNNPLPNNTNNNNRTEEEIHRETDVHDNSSDCQENFNNNYIAVGQRKIPSSSETTLGILKRQTSENIPLVKIKSLKEMAIDNLLVQPNGFETLLDIGIPIHEILEDLTESNETLNNIETTSAESHNKDVFEDTHAIELLSHMEHFVDRPGAPPIPPPRRDSFIRMECGPDYALASSNILTPQSCPLSPRSTSSLSSIAYPINQISDQWYAAPSEDPHLIACLSPSQSSSSKPLTPKEVSSLIDLHKKFVDRRGYHESRDTSSISTPDSERTPNKERHMSTIENIHNESRGLGAGNNIDDSYTPELLQEAANLLSLKHYHDCRQKKMTLEKLEKNTIENKNGVQEDITQTKFSPSHQVSERDHSDLRTIKNSEMDNKFENESRPSKLLALIQENKQQTCVVECIPEREIKDMHNVDEPLYSTNQSNFKSENINTPNRNSSEQSERLSFQNKMYSSLIPKRNFLYPGEESGNAEVNYQFRRESDSQEETPGALNIVPSTVKNNITDTGNNKTLTLNNESDNINTSIQQEIEKLESFDFETLLQNFEDKNRPTEPASVERYDKAKTGDKEQNSVIVQYKISKKGDIAELSNNYDFEKQEIIKRDTGKVLVHINKIATKDNVVIVEESNDTKNIETCDNTFSENHPFTCDESQDENSMPFARNDMGVQTVERREKKSKIPVVKKSPLGLPVVLNQEKSAQSNRHRSTSNHHRKCSHLTNEVRKSKSEELRKFKPSSNTQMESMYNEYMKEISAKRERRKRRMIKLEERATSLTNIKETINASDIYTTSIKVKNQLENEFMNKVQQRMNKYGINMKDYEVTNNYITSSEDEIDARDVPKHLQDFIEISKNGELQLTSVSCQSVHILFFPLPKFNTGRNP